METKELARIFKAVTTHVSKDVTRSHLTRVAVTSDRRLEATDGHRAIRVDTDPPHGLAVGLYDVKKSLALLKAGILPQPEEALPSYWPAFDRVIPALCDEGTARRLGIRPAYIAAAAEAVTEAAGLDKSTGIYLQAGKDALDPIRLDATGQNARAVAVVMPMRLA